MHVHLDTCMSHLLGAVKVQSQLITFCSGVSTSCQWLSLPCLTGTTENAAANQFQSFITDPRANGRYRDLPHLLHPPHGTV